MTRAVMTIHGFLTDVNDFERLYPHLVGYDKVVACKIPGHNDKQDLKQFTVENTIATVENCFDDLAKDYDQVDIVGFSMGGALATYLATKRNVNKLVLIAPANKYINLATPLATLKFYLRFVWKNYTNTSGPLKERFANTKQALSPYIENMKISGRIAFHRMFPNINVHTFTVFVNLIKHVNKQLQGKTFEVPTLALWGELDELVPKSSLPFVKKHFCNFQALTYHDVGHAMLMSHKTEQIVENIVSFVGIKTSAKNSLQQVDKTVAK